MDNQVEYVGGPADGMREPLPAAAATNPAPMRVVSLPPRIASALDGDQPVETHRYRRDPRVSDRTWFYRYAGRVSDELR